MSRETRATAQAREALPEAEGEGLLRTLLEEVRRLGTEQRQTLEAFHQKQKEMEDRLSQLSLPNRNINSEGTGTVEEPFLDFKFAANLYDDSGSLRDFLNQFHLIAKAGNWSNFKKTSALISSLKAEARSVLEGIPDLESITFEDLVSKLRLRFGEGESLQNSYVNFVNRKQERGEDFSLFGCDLERLSRLAYPESSSGIRDRLACAQFINSIFDNN